MHSGGGTKISDVSTREGLDEILVQQLETSYESVPVQGENICTSHTHDILDDWQVQKIMSILYQKRSGLPSQTRTLYAIVDKVDAQGSDIMTGAEVTGFPSMNRSGSVRSVETNSGMISFERGVEAIGPQIRNSWPILDRPCRMTVEDLAGGVHQEFDMWHFCGLEQGLLWLETGELHPVSNSLCSWSSDDRIEGETLKNRDNGAVYH